MGVASVWEATKRGFDERLPFNIFVTNFYKENGRPIRIAIDAFQWLFEAGSFNNGGGLPFNVLMGKVKQNFHAKIREMISLNVSFILVFDGKFKPNFKRNIDLQKRQNDQLERKDFDSEYLKFKELNENDQDSSHYVNDMPDILELKKELKRWNISYVDAPSEGEAEASRLQRLGVVDYVLSNDSDTIIFGATKILRNFSRSEEDKPASNIGPKPHEYYWCTPVHMDKIKQKTGFDRWRVLLFSILTGADYNNGVKYIGVEKALQLALSSTDFMTRHVATCPYNTFPDFAYQLKEIYYNDDDSDGVLPRSEMRRLKYEDLQVQMFQHISENIMEYFGRNEKNVIKDGSLENFPPDYVVMLYFYPLLKKDIFKFEIGTTNYAETDDASKWIKLPHFNESLHLFKKNPPPNVSNVDIWFTRILSEAYLLRFLIHDLEIPASIEKMKTKEIGTFDLDLFGVRFKYYFPFGELKEYEDSNDPEIKKLIRAPLKWIPKDLIPITTQHYKSYIEREELKRKEEEEKVKTKRKSPRKKKPSQSSTLISMGFIDAPTKDTSTPLLQRRKSNVSQKPSTGVSVLDMLRARKAVKTPVPVAAAPPIASSLPPAQSPSPTKSSPIKSNLFFNGSDSESSLDEDSDLESGIGSSPVKTVKESPIKVQSEVKSTIQESPIKVKSRKQDINTSPSKGNKSYNFNDLEGDKSFSTAKKKLDFTNIQNSSTPLKKTPIDSLNTPKVVNISDVSMVTIDDTSMVEDSSIMEISHISGKHESKADKRVDQDEDEVVVIKDVRDNPQLTETKKYSALDDILQPLEYSSDEDSSD